ncbi:MAG: sugar phosphate isomerase/epimerase [Tannerella sp.]|nr:sugar phosphate isomerase/epimerase [Tannerella sp.]
MQNRRDFIKKASMLMAGGVMMPRLLSSCGEAAPAKYIGLQLYSLRDDIQEKGIRPILEIVAKMGYTDLETANYNAGQFYGLAPAEFRKIVEDLGMRLSSSHLSRTLSDNRDADMAWWQTALEAHVAAGMKYMIMPMAPLMGEGATLDNVKRYGDYFSQIGLITLGASVKFGYHNHNFEFTEKIDGVPVYDLLLENTSPDHVLFENDVYWCQKGGGDPVAYMKKYPNRIKVLHIKDEEAIGASGYMNFKPIFDTAYEIGVKDWYVEVERYIGTPEQDVKQSADFLKAADYVK